MTRIMSKGCRMPKLKCMFRSSQINQDYCVKAKEMVVLIKMGKAQAKYYAIILIIECTYLFFLCKNQQLNSNQYT